MNFVANFVASFVELGVYGPNSAVRDWRLPMKVSQRGVAPKAAEYQGTKISSCNRLPHSHLCYPGCLLPARPWPFDGRRRTKLLKTTAASC
jgi:hypothetical protein